MKIWHLVLRNSTNSSVVNQMHKQNVFITSRPGSHLTCIEPIPGIRAQLQNLSEKDAKEYVAQYPEDQVTFSDINKKFGMPFLERPVHLTLACYVYLIMSAKGLHRVSDTELFSQIIVATPNYLHRTKCPSVQEFLSKVHWNLFSNDDSRLNYN